MSFLSRIFGKKKDKWEEKRKFIRLTAHHLLRYKIMEKGSQVSFARNISAGGVLFYSKEALPQGSMVEMEINFPHYPHPVKVVSKVVRVHPLEKLGGFEIGAEFVNVEEDAKDFINRKIITVQDQIEKESGEEEKGSGAQEE